MEYQDASGAIPEEDLSYPTEAEAEYTLESPMGCPGCGRSVETVHVIRLLRTKVNFTSSLPRRGYVVICPKCKVAIPAVVG